MSPRQRDVLKDLMGTEDWFSVNQVAWEWRFGVAAVRACFAACGPEVLERKRCERTGRTLYRWVAEPKPTWNQVAA